MRRFKYVLHGLVLGALVALGVNVAIASRNSGGSYSLPNPAVVTGTNISSAWANSTLNDLATEITNSLDRSGRGAMTGPLRLKSGLSAAAPDLAWDVETNTGFYRAASGDIRFAIAGVDSFKYNSTGLYVLGTTPVLLAHDVIGGFAGMWSGAAASAPVVTNYNVLTSATTTLLNAPTGGSVELRINNQPQVVMNGVSVTSTVPFTIGASGTAIAQSNRGTVVWNPGTIGSGGVATNTITVNGAVTGADCIADVLSPAPLSGAKVQCIVTAANTCGIAIWNPSAGGLPLGSATFYCRTFNP